MGFLWAAGAVLLRKLRVIYSACTWRE